MSNNKSDLDLEKSITIRIMLKESNIKKLAFKYSELLSKMNTDLSKAELLSYLNDIMNEINLIEIGILKNENILKIKNIDKEYNKNITININNKINEAINQIKDSKNKLIKSKEQKEYKVECESVAKLIDEYDSKSLLGKKIEKLDKENKTILNKNEFLNKKLKEQSNKMSLVFNLVNDLKGEFKNALEDVKDIGITNQQIDLEEN